MEINRDEILRYLVSPKEAIDSSIIDKCINKAQTLSPQHITAIYDIKFIADGIVLQNGVKFKGNLVKNSLLGCTKIIILVATLTTQADRLVNTSHGILEEAAMNATMTTFIEAYCDKIEKELNTEYNKKNLYLTKRFSAGYGDFPLSSQADILKATNAEKLLGIHLSNEYVMQPLKTVTAIIGIADKPIIKDNKKCKQCKANCIYRINTK